MASPADDRLVEKYVLPVLLLMAGGIISAVVGAFGPLPLAVGLLVAVVVILGLRLYRVRQENDRLRQELAVAEKAVEVPASNLGRLTSAESQVAEWKSASVRLKEEKLRLQSEVEDLRARLRTAEERGVVEGEGAALGEEAEATPADDVRDMLETQLKQIP